MNRSVQLLLLGLLFYASAAVAQQTSLPQPAALPIEVTAQQMEADQQQRQAIFSGKVVAKQGDITLYCDKLVVYSLPEQDQVDRLEASGNVRVVQLDRTATADRAVYRQQQGTLVLYGHAKVHQGQNLVADFQSMGLTLGRHPLALLRAHLNTLRMATAAEIRRCRHGEHVRAAGIVINRQRPSTASGVVFMTLEDETGHINAVVWPWVVERQRREVVASRMLGIHGTIEREGEVVHLVVGRIADLSHLLGSLHTSSRDFQ